ncbi:hypothetical protein HOO54_17315 [Bacillus sp. WMMC1349]|uniref:hypothetical protein n=1 Tax=Bacillus sp. WMMC1349 TaxID=2736254 RepID=UPI0015568A8C|nr:hypothetical protein [Bacillus sp. WMMC1349]NPC93925.1 hypothetical protein [Bacillus sp. WMMC1349]
MSGKKGANEIQVEFQELLDISRILQEIYGTYHHEVERNIKTMSQIKYYPDGQAADIMKSYKKILEKILEVQDNYLQAQQIVNYALAEMIKSDKTLAEQISSGKQN